jgi:hypothetical protein
METPKLRDAGIVPGGTDEEKWYGVVPINQLLVSFWRKRDGGILF